VQFQSQDDPEPQRDVPGLRVPTSGLLALAVEDNAQQGVLLLASAGATGTTTANVIATYWGSNLQPGQAVTPLGWSADGYELLVSAGHVSSSLVEASCSDLYIVRYEDSRVIVSEVTGDPSGNGAASGASTGNGLPGRAEEGAVSPDGSLVAYFESGELWLVDVHDRGSLQGLDRCRDHLGTPRWSPDGTHLFALCEGSIVVADTSEFTSGSLSVERFSGPRGALLLTAGWAADSRSILTVAAVTGKALSSPLEIIAFDAASGAGTERAVTLTQTQWVLGPAAMSPDGRWALLQGNDTYALDIATGEATNLPWIVFSAARDTVAWLPDGNTFLYADSGTLYEIDLASMTRTEVGAIPVSNFAWHESPK
jgi:Tol biopolymer transport system component